MAKELDKKVVELLKKHGYGKEAVWDCHGTWVVYHKILEDIANRVGITFQSPHVCCADLGNVAICVHGEMEQEVGNEKVVRIEWSIGEASPKNNKNSYPWAMAEKRAKDRVILKLIGLHGLVYSEQEADEFKEEKPDNVKGNKMKTKEAMKRFSADVQACEDIDTLEVFLACDESKALKKSFETVIPEWVDDLRSEINDKRKKLKEFDNVK